MLILTFYSFDLARSSDEGIGWVRRGVSGYLKYLGWGMVYLVQKVPTFEPFFIKVVAS